MKNLLKGPPHGLILSPGSLTDRDRGFARIQIDRDKPGSSETSILPVLAGDRNRDFDWDWLINAYLSGIRILNALDGVTEVNQFYDLHSKQKLSLMARDPNSQKEIGRLLANCQDQFEFDETKSNYLIGYLGTFDNQTTRGKHRNVLEHAVGYLEDVDSTRLNELVARFYDGDIPWHVPYLNVLRAIELTGNEWLMDQSYFNLSLLEYQLRKHFWLCRWNHAV